MSDVPPVSTELSAAELRRLRRELQLQVRETHTWSDLLRHKAHALRATSGAALEPQGLAQALAAAGPLRSQPVAPARGLRAVDSDVEGVLSRARAVWEEVADSTDPEAVRDLADAADRMADRLDRLGLDVDAQLRSGDELARRLAPTRPKDGPYER